MKPDKSLLLGRSDGGVSVMHLHNGADEDECVRKWEAPAKGVTILRRVPVAYEQVESQPRRLRAAWKLEDNAIAVDDARAREIVLAELRAERNAKLLASDAEKIRVDEIGSADEKRAIADYRKTLRDLPAVETPKIDALTVSELETYHPTWPTLPGEQSDRIPRPS